MTDLNEKLSSMLDGDSEDEMAETLDAVIADVNLQYRMRRLQMIGEAMRHELPPAIDTGFHSSVMARIREQDNLQADSQTPNVASESTGASFFRWTSLRPIAGLAVAASVALVTVALWQPLQRQDGQQAENLVTADQQKIQQLAGQSVQAAAVPVSTNGQPLGMRWKVERETPGLQQKLNAYLVNHTEYSNSVQGLIPQARVAGFDTQQ